MLALVPLFLSLVLSSRLHVKKSIHELYEEKRSILVNRINSLDPQTIHPYAAYLNQMLALQAGDDLYYDHKMALQLIIERNLIESSVILHLLPRFGFALANNLVDILPFECHTMHFLLDYAAESLPRFLKKLESPDQVFACIRNDLMTFPSQHFWRQMTPAQLHLEPKVATAILLCDVGTR